MAKKDEAKAEGEAAIVETPDSPLLDLSDAAVKRMLKIAKKRGWVTQDELNAVLPSEEIWAEPNRGCISGSPRRSTTAPRAKTRR